MDHEKLKWMKDALICVVENQLCNIGEVDTEELGDAIDMIKDLEEAIYYCTVTEAMNKQGKEMHMEMKKGDHQQSPEDDRMYYGYPMMYADNGRRRRADGTFYADGGQSGSGGGQSYMYADGGQSGSGGGQSYMYADGGQSRSGGQNYMYADSGMANSGNGTSSRNYADYAQGNGPEGRSPYSRRMYMEAKHMNKDNATQLRELEKYMQELSTDVTEMISDASPEEKQYLEKKISALASKIGQMK